MSDNKEAAAKELEIRKRIEQAQAGERFAAYRRGWQDGTSIRPVLEFVKWQEDYNHGYVAGRQELRNTMNKKRRDYGLPAEKTVHIA